MTTVDAEELFRSGRAHALSAKLLFDASLDFANAEGIGDAEKFAFNGTFSLSVHYLLGLAAELMLKAAYIAHGGNAEERHLRNDIGHDLSKVLELAKSQGFQPNVENFDQIVELLNEPYLRHFFRYTRPQQFALPDVLNVIEAYAVVDEQLCNTFGWSIYK